MWIVDFEGWLTVITNSGKFNIIFDISSIGGLLAMATNLDRFQERYLTITYLFNGGRYLKKCIKNECKFKSIINPQIINTD